MTNYEYLTAQVQAQPSGTVVSPSKPSVVVEQPASGYPVPAQVLTSSSSTPVAELAALALSLAAFVAVVIAVTRR